MKPQTSRLPGGWFSAWFTLWLLASGAVAQPRYVLTDLGQLGGVASEAYGLNNAGHVVGLGKSPRGNLCPCVYFDGVVQFLDTFPSPVVSGHALGINAHDVVIGEDYGNHVAFRFAAGQITRLGSLGGPSGQSFARAINNGGTIVGNTTMPNGKMHAFVYTNQQMLDLGTLGGDESDGFAINNSGVVVGWSLTTNGSYQAFRYDPVDGMRPLIANSQAYGVNDAGVVVGMLFTAGGPQPFRFQSNVLSRLPTQRDFGGEAQSVNNSNQIVGQALTGAARRYAVIWEGNVAYDLTQLIVSNLDWSLSYATAINDAGQIVGYGVKGTVDENSRAYLLTPITPPASTNRPPTVTLLMPTNNAQFVEHDNIPIEVAASDPDGEGVRVELLAGTNSLGVLTTRPYNLVWSNVPPGNFAITALATDDQGTNTTSTPINVMVFPWSDILVSSPEEGASFYPGEPIPLAAIVTGSNALVTSVQFYADGQLIGTDTNTPYNLTWSNAPLGSHLLIALATDSFGRRISSPAIHVTVAPRITVTLLTPEPGAIFLMPVDIVFRAEVTDLEAPIEKVEFYFFSDKIGEATTPPYTAVWRNATAGGFDVTVRATDSLGYSRTSSVVRVTVLNPAFPQDVVWIGAAGDWFAPSNWTLRVPMPQDHAWIDNGGTAVVASGDAHAHKLTLGSAASGQLQQTGGTLAVTNQVLLAEKTGSQGSYSLSGNGVLHAGELGIGSAGNGMFTQNGGTSVTANLFVAGDVDGSGTYELNAGWLAAQTEHIASYNVGIFRQNSGTNSVSSLLTVGNNRSDTRGTYELHGGRLQAAAEVIGNDGSGFFLQTGGENRVSGDCEIGRFWEGTYEITNGLLAVSNLLVTSGRVAIQSSRAQIIVSNRLVFGDQSLFSAAPGSSIRLLGNAFDVQSFRMLFLWGLTNLNLVVDAANPLTTVEAFGNRQRAFEENAFLAALVIGDSAPGHVRLVDRRDNDNQGNPGDEALFVGQLFLRHESSLDLNGLPLFLREPPAFHGELLLSQGSVISSNGLQISADGEMHGAGVIVGDLLNEGLIDLGTNRGRLQLNGDFTQSGTGRFDFALAGVNAGTQYDQITVSGKATFDGALRVHLADGYTPAAGDAFRVVTYEQRTNNFASVILPRPTNGVAFQLTDSDDASIVEAVTQPNLHVAAPVHLNPQSGLYEALVVLSNAGPTIIYSSRILIRDLPPGSTVYNASGTDAGDPFVRYKQPLAPSETVQFTLEFYVPDRRSVPNPTLIADAAYLASRFTATGTVLTIDRSVTLPDGSALIEFSTETSRTYYVQYSDDMTDWKTALPAIIGNGSRVQWVDNGSPKTSSKPDAQAKRFYRIVLVP